MKLKFLIFLLYLNCSSINYDYKNYEIETFSVTYSVYSYSLFNRKLYEVNTSDVCSPDYDYKVEHRYDLLLFYLTLNNIRKDYYRFTCYKRGKEYDEKVLKSYSR